MRNIVAINFNKLNQTILKSFDARSEKEIVKNFTNVTIEILKSDFGFCFLKDSVTKKLKLAYKHPKTPFAPPPPRSTGVTQQAFKQEVPVYEFDYTKSKWVINTLKPFLRGFVSIPINFRSNNYGTFNICYKNTHRFTDEEKDLCVFIGNAAAQAITINRLYNRQKRFNTRLENRVQERTREIKEDKARDEAVLSSIGEGIIAVDKEAKVILANPQAEIILGIKQSELLGELLLKAQPLYEENGKLVALENRPAYQALTKHRKYKVRNYYLQRKNGDRIPVSITATPIIINGKVAGAIQAFHDIIKEKEIDKAKSELISLASHQLRTPLSAINWYTEALVKEELGKVNQQQKKYLKEINNANQKMIELVYDFLNVSRIELGTFVIQLSEFSVKEVAQGVLKELQPVISRKKLKLEEAYLDGCEHIHADKKIIRLILQNLLSNAVKYTPNKGVVKLKIGVARKSKPRLAIEVSDNGYGIPEHQHEKIFSKLFRADNITQLQTEGTGLGLYIVKSFVDLCKGKITFISKINKGTRFSLELPLETAARPAAIKTSRHYKQN